MLYLPHMEPQLPSPSRSPESGTTHVQGGETFSGAIQPETQPQQPERHEAHEQYAGGPAGDPVATQSVAPTPPPLPSIAPQQAVQDAPASAADEDLIEKEWVERAKKVVAETKHDPYLQGREVSKLQADYLNKRYSKSISRSIDGA